MQQSEVFLPRGQGHTLSDDLHAKLYGSRYVSPSETKISVAHHRVEVRGKQAAATRDLLGGNINGSE